MINMKLRFGNLKKYNLKKNILLRGGIFAIIMFLLCTINNSIWGAFWGALVGWFLYAIICMIIIGDIEYFTPRSKQKRLLEKKYQYLFNIGFRKTEDFNIEGYYKDFHIIICPQAQKEKRKKNIHYDIVYASYKFDDTENDEDIEVRERNMCGSYHIGDLIFRGCAVTFVPYQWKDPDFEDILTHLISILKRENLKPKDKSDSDL